MIEAVFLAFIAGHFTGWRRRGRRDHLSVQLATDHAADVVVAQFRLEATARQLVGHFDQCRHIDVDDVDALRSALDDLRRLDQRAHDGGAA